MTTSQANGAQTNGLRKRYGYEPSPDQSMAKPAHHPVIIVGGGLVGLTTAIELISKGIPAIVLERTDTVSEGSRSICQAKRTLEIWDRLGVGDVMVERGVTWKTGKVFDEDQLLYSFDLLPENGHKMPAFVNLQQFYVEEYLIERLEQLDGGVRWRNEVTSVEQHGDHVRLMINTPDGAYEMTCDWLIACDGARSGVRRQLDLSFDGKVFRDKFLITDVKMKADFPSERWFWFEPPFHNGQTALLHRQANDVWRIDLQLGWDADNEEEQRLERVEPRIRAMLGDGVDFEIIWVSVYVFQCRTLSDYVHGRVIFAGDAAHQVSPFGARGGNAGVQDTDNLGWKLKLVLDGLAPSSLLETYTAERLYAARENLLHSTRATDFITPKSQTSRILRDQTLALASEYPFAQSLVNSGRLSVPAHLTDSSLNTADEDRFDCDLAPGSPAKDAPVMGNGKAGWLLGEIGNRFTAIAYEPNGADLPAILNFDGVPVDVKCVGSGCAITDCDEMVRKRYDLTPGSVYLFRPDHHIAARWRSFDVAKIENSVMRAVGRH
jgi:3-(3-hydroxy-phenyl)propionate hydroxylase